jgi:chromosome segregation and condensation protein ScpB
MGITMAGLSGLSDEALAVFAFAAYHQLSSGQMVRSVVQRDGAGHKASDTAVSELRERGLIEADGSEIRFTPQGEEALQGLISGLRGG